MKSWLLSMMLMVTLVAMPIQKAQAINLGPFKVGVQFCEQVQRLAPLLNVYSMVQWPVMGFPGITFGLSQNTSALLDFCDFIMQIEQLDTQDAIFFAGNYLNKLTDKKWNDHLDFASQTWDLANTVYDFESGQHRKGALESAMTHRQINDYMKTSYEWYNKTFNSIDAKLKNRGEREMEMNAFSQVAYKRAILAEALTCPGGDTNAGQKDYEKVYAKEIQPNEVKRDQSKDDIDFYKSKLLDMGPRFANNQDMLSQYVKDIENLEVKAVNYSIKIKPKTETTIKQVPGKGGAAPTQQKVNIKRDTQVFEVMVFADQFTNFKKNWGDKWSSYVTAAFLSNGSEGLLTDPQAKIENEFKDFSYECNATKLMRGVSVDRPDYDKLQDERVEQCNKDTRMNQKKAENLMNYFVQQLQSSLYRYKLANAAIWTSESWYLGVTRSVNSKNSTEGYQQEQVTCAENMEPAEMQKIGLKQQQVETEYAEITAKQVMKQNAMMEEQAKAEAADREERNKRQAFQDKKNEDTKKATQTTGTSFTPINGTISDGQTGQ